MYVSTAVTTVTSERVTILGLVKLSLQETIKAILRNPNQKIVPKMAIPQPQTAIMRTGMIG